MDKQSELTKRISWIDLLKFLGIYLVILGHSGVSQPIHDYLYAFHMPLFFAISGFLFSFNKFPDLGSFLKKRANQILKPYLFFSVVTYLFWFFVGRKFGADKILNISPLTPIIGTIYGNGVGYYYIHAAALWFLPCLFMVELMFFLAFRYVQKIWISFLIILSFLFLGKTLLYFDLLFFPWSINVALIAIFFYWFGFMFKKYLYVCNWSYFNEVLILIILCLSFYFLVPLNGSVDMSSSNYQNIFLFVINALIGTLSFFLIAKLWSKSRFSVFEYLGRNTLIILAFHTIILSCIKGVSLYVFHIPLDYLSANFPINCLISLIALSLCLIPIYIMNRFFPYITGRVKVSEKY